MLDLNSKLKRKCTSVSYLVQVRPEVYMYISIAASIAVDP